MTTHDVVLVSHGFQTNYERGFANGLVANGAPTVLIGSDRSDARALDPRVRFVNLRGSQEEGRPRWRKALNLLRYHLRLLAFVALRRPTTVHMIGLIEPAWLHGLLEGTWFRLFCGRYVLTVHDVMPHDRHTPWNRRLSRWTFRLADRLVVHTAVTRDRLIREFGIAAQRIVVMEHGLEPIAAWPRARLPQKGVALRPPILLCFGIVKAYKGIDLLLEAFERLDRACELRIVGVCHDASLKADLESRIARHPSRERIRWRACFVDEDEMNRWFAEADALVLPYRHIDQSGVLFQALRHGLPVVATKVGAFPRYVGPEVGEICEPGDADALASALRRLLSRLGSIDRRRIRERAIAFEWSTTVRALEAAYG